MGEIRLTWDKDYGKNQICKFFCDWNVNELEKQLSQQGYRLEKIEQPTPQLPEELGTFPLSSFTSLDIRVFENRTAINQLIRYLKSKEQGR